MKKCGIIKSVTVFVLAIALLSSGCGAASKKPVKTPAKKPVVNPGAASMKEAPKEMVTQTVALYFSNRKADMLVHEIRKVSAPVDEIPAALVKELIRGPVLSGGVQTIPGKTKLRSFRVTNRIAYTNFSKEISSQLQGGSAGERMTVYSVVNSLARLSGIDKVQFLIEGKKVDSLAGHIDLTKPLAPDYSLVYVPPAANPRIPAELGEPEQPTQNQPSQQTPEPAKKPGMQTTPKIPVPVPQPGFNTPQIPQQKQPVQPFSGGAQDGQNEKSGAMSGNEKSLDQSQNKK